MTDAPDQVLIALPADAPDPGALARSPAPGHPTLRLGRAAPLLHLLISGDFPIPVDRAAALGVSFDVAGWEGVLMGGTPLATRTAGGAIRWIDAAGVARRARMLGELDLARCRTGWDPAWFAEMGCGDWSQDPAEIDAVIAKLLALRDFFAAAAARGDGVVTYVP